MNTTPRASVRYLSSTDRYEQLNGLTMAYNVSNDVIDGVAGNDALETIFRQCNHVDGKEWINPLHCGFRTRSLSVGDTVELDGKHYVCEGIGWTEVSKDVADWLVEHVTSRDFCHTVGSTIAILLRAGRTDIPSDTPVA